MAGSGPAGDITGMPFLTGTDQTTLDLITITTNKTYLPVDPADYLSYLTQLAFAAIEAKYSKTLSGTIAAGNNILAVPSTTGLYTDMVVSALDSNAASVFPVGTKIMTIRDAASVTLTENALVSITSIDTFFSMSGLSIDYSIIPYVMTVVDFTQL